MIDGEHSLFVSLHTQIHQSLVTQVSGHCQSIRKSNVHTRGGVRNANFHHLTKIEVGQN